jgi:2-polyprenyl-6-hydroxyphenyl methylase / 3-demethylubiquinone-9 3-methyltransferase
MTQDGHANVDPHEVQQFDELASSWWDTQGPLRTLHHLNPTRVDYVVTRTGGLHTRRAVDVGCGGGILSEALAQHGADVVGIDLSAQALDAACLHLYETGLQVDYRCVSAEDLGAQEPGTFDLVTCLELLEHVPDPASTIAACAQLAKPGADIFFSTINRTPRAYALAVVGAEYVARLLPRGTHEYDRFIRPSELEETGRHNGLELVHMSGLAYNPLTRSARLVRDVGVNYMAHFRRTDDA